MSEFWRTTSTTKYAARSTTALPTSPSSNCKSSPRHTCSFFSRLAAPHSNQQKSPRHHEFAQLGRDPIASATLAVIQAGIRQTLDSISMQMLPQQASNPKG